MADPRQFSAPAERNSRPILDVLRQVLPASGTVLVVGPSVPEGSVANPA